MTCGVVYCFKACGAAYCLRACVCVQATGATYGSPPQFDIVCANILRGPLFELAPRLLSYMHPGSTLVLSGLLEEQVCMCEHVSVPHPSV